MEIDIQGVLFPNALTMAVQLCATFVLFLMCKKLLWKPAREILAKRKEKMNADLAEAERLKKESTEELEKAKENLLEARNKSGEIVESAKKEANSLRDEIINKANKEASDRLDLADKQIAQKRKDASDQIHDEMVEVAMAAVSKLMDEKSTSKDDEKAIKDYIDGVNKKS